MCDHKIVALCGIVADRGGGIVHHKHAIGIDELEGFRSAHFLLNAGQCIVHALAERQVIDGTGHHYRDAEGLRRRGRRFGHNRRGCVCWGYIRGGSDGFGHWFGGRAAGTENKRKGNQRCYKDFFHLLSPCKLDLDTILSSGQLVQFG